MFRYRASGFAGVADWPYFRRRWLVSSGPAAAGSGAGHVLRGLLEHWRATVAHQTAATVQLRLRRRLFDKVAALGPGYVGQQRSGDVTLSLVDGVEQLEVYFGQYLPQLLVSLLTPLSRWYPLRQGVERVVPVSTRTSWYTCAPDRPADVSDAPWQSRGHSVG